MQRSLSRGQDIRLMRLTVSEFLLEAVKQNIYYITTVHYDFETL